MKEVLIYLPLFLIFLLILWNRRKNHTEFQKLGQEEKVALFQNFSRYRLVQFGGLLGSLALLLAGSKAPSKTVGAAIIAAAALTLVASFFFIHRFAAKKLREMRLPESYIRVYLQDRIILGVLMIGLTAVAAADLLQLDWKRWLP